MIARCVRLVLLLALLSAPFTALAQQGAKVPSPRSPKIPRVGYLTPTSLPTPEEVFRQELRRIGYTEGQNLTIEYRSADGRSERLSDLAAELVALKVDVIVVVVTEAALAAKKATSTIPIVMVGVSDPVGTGLVASLGRPGGNVTGTSAPFADVVGKQLEFLHEMLPKVSLVAVLWNPANAVFQKLQLTRAQAAATKLKMQLHTVEARKPEDLDRAFAAITRQRPDALLVLSDPLFGSHAARIFDLAVRHRLPAASSVREYADAGALMTYGPSFADAYRGAATYVDRILKGGKPADLPVEQSTRYELVINTRTARALGVTIPPSLAVRADQVL